MRIDEPITFSGFFWLPEEPDFHVPGDLHISEVGEPRLEVRLQEISPGWRHLINASMSGNGYEATRILGIHGGQGQFTLEECRVTKWQTFGIPFTELTLIAKFALAGCHYDPGEKVTFDEFTFSVEGLDEWLAVSGINVQFDSEIKKSFIDVHVPEVISLDLPDGAVLKFKFGMTFPSLTRTITEAHVTQKAYASLVSCESKPIDYFTSLATKLRNFLRLVIGRPVSMDSATGYSRELTRSDGGGGETRVPIQVYYREAGASNQKQEVSWFHMLFLYTEVQSQLEEKLADWLQSYDVFGPAIDVYFTAMANTSQYLEVEFLQRVQGLETLHRRSSLETEMPGDEYIGILDSLLSACPSDRREWLRSRLRYANELSLRKRLRAMIEPFERFFGSNRQQKDFIAKVVDTRNYLTHYDKSLEGQTAEGQDLWELTKALEALFLLHLLRSIGFDNEGIDQVLQRPHSLQQLLTSSGMHVREEHGPETIPIRGALFGARIARS